MRPASRPHPAKHSPSRMLSSIFSKAVSIVGTGIVIGNAVLVVALASSSGSRSRSFFKR